MAEVLSGGTLTTVLLLTALPFALLATTSFIKIAVVLSILRSGLGAAQVPSAMLTTLLAILLSAYVMAPVFDDVIAAVGPSASEFAIDGALDAERLAELATLWTEGTRPVRGFLAKHADDRERALFARLLHEARARDTDTDPVVDDDLLVLMPAFLITELKEGLQIGFLLLLPFLVLDLVVASILAALGLQTVSVAVVSLPLKLLLFVLTDGWYVLAEALVRGYS